jgi:hypothetical protein
MTITFLKTDVQAPSANEHSVRGGTFPKGTKPP